MTSSVPMQLALMRQTNPRYETILRRYLAYAQDFVEEYDFCPWAKKARLSGQVEIQIFEGIGTSNHPLLTETISKIANNPETVIVLFLFPDFQDSRQNFEHFVSEVHQEHVKQSKRRQKRPSFVTAAFFPIAEPNFRSNATLVPFIRQSPYPLIQWVRLSVLEKTRGPQTKTFFDPQTMSLQDLNTLPKESTSEKVARKNRETIERVGIETLQQVLANIRNA